MTLAQLMLYQSSGKLGGGTFGFALNKLHRLPSVGIFKGAQGFGKASAGRKGGRSSGGSADQGGSGVFS